MLQIMQLEEIKGLFLHVPMLIDAFEARSPGFAREVKEWFRQIEHVLTQNKLPVVADVATLRGLLIGAERGLIPDGIQLQGQMTTRKVTMAAALDLLHKAETAVSQAIQTDLDQLDEAERLTQQIVVVAQNKGLISIKPSEIHRTQLLKETWQHIASDPELMSVATHLTGLVGVYDVLILLDRAMP